jgi:hypothetical protein
MSKVITEQQWGELDTAYKNMTGSMLGFCKLVVSEAYSSKQKEIAERYSVSPGTVSKWVTVGENADKFRSAKDLPTSMEALYMAAKLPPTQFKKLCITADTTRKDVQAVMPKKKTATTKSGAKSTPKMTEAKGKESVFEVLNTIDLDTVRKWLNEWEQEHTQKAA